MISGGECMARTNRLLIAAGIVCLSSLPSVSGFRHVDWKGSIDRSWARGPVWYIMTTGEYRAYRRLASEPDRRAFIRGFWDQRDPIPQTEDNELEREFWRRVDVAEGHFGQEVKPGWKTERGKVFIMLGPPDNLETDQILHDTWGSARWAYDLGSMPLQLRLVLQDSLGIPANRRVASLKVRSESEATRAVSGRTPLDNSVLRPTDALPLAERLVRRIPGPDALRNLGHVMRVPEVLDRLSTQVHVSTVFSHVPVEARIDFRPASAAGPDGTTAVTVTLGVDGDDLYAAGVTRLQPQEAILTGHLTGTGRSGATHSLTGTFAPAPDGEAGPDGAGMLVFQTVASVPPGRYLLDVAYQDPEERIMGAVRDVIDVPAFTPEGLRVSSLVLSSRLEPLPPAREGAGPFEVAGYRVVPRTNQTYRTSESLQVFYEVRGASAGDDGRPHLDHTYQFYIEDAGSWLPVGSPITLADLGEPGRSWSVPLAGWPAGSYRLETLVSDMVTGDAATRTVLFEIAPGTEP